MNKLLIIYSSLLFSIFGSGKPQIDIKTGTIAFLEDEVLTEDSIIVANSVFIGGRIITHEKNLTIICREIIFSPRNSVEKSSTLTPPFRSEIQSTLPHIGSITGYFQQDIRKKEMHITPGFIKIVAGKIIGHPIIHKSVNLYEIDTKLPDPNTSIELHYAETSEPENKTFFSKIFTGSPSSLAIKKDMNEQNNRFLKIRKSAAQLAHIVLFFKLQENLEEELKGLPEFEAWKLETKSIALERKMKDLLEIYSKKIRDTNLEDDDFYLENAQKIHDKLAVDINRIFKQDLVDTNSMMNQTKTENPSILVDSAYQWRFKINTLNSWDWFRANVKNMKAN
jgi:hypothetical protein